MRLASGASGRSPAATLAALLCAGCTHVATGPVDAIAAAGPGRVWQPPPEEAAARAREIEALPPPPPLPTGPLDLPALVDLALRNDPDTRAAWAAAREAAEAVGVARASAWPTLTVGAQAGTVRNQFSPTLAAQHTDAGLTSSLAWLLFDSGGQQARVAAAKQALLAADWGANDQLATVVLDVEQSWYRYVGARAQVAAARESVDVAQRNLDAATARKDAGLGTIADVLQATTARSRAQLDLETAEGQEAVMRGTLATNVGLPPDTPLDAGELPESVDLERGAEEVGVLLREAVARRPDLAAAAWQVAEARSQVRVTRAQGLPSVSLAGAYDPTWFVQPPSSGQATSSWSYGGDYSAAVTLTVPLFQGFLVRHQTRSAVAAFDLAQARLEALDEQVQLQAWTSAQNVRTAAQSVRTAHDLLASAQENEDVAAERYRRGVGSILELLAAQGALAQARAGDAQARADFLLAVAQLARDTGAIEIPEVKP